MDKNIIVYFVTEHGAVNIDLFKVFMNMFEEKGYAVENFGMGSAYNMPIYLLGEVEENIEKAVVVSFYMNGDKPVPMVFFDQNEVDALIEGLENAGDDADSFDIAKEVHKRIRE